MSLYICRHGQTEANASGLLLGRADPELNDVGRAQAKAIVGAVPAPARIVSSPLARCRATAEAFDRPVEIDERLIELDYGRYDLRPMAEIPAETWAAWRADPDFRPPDGETLNELAARVSPCLDELAADASVEDVMVVTHVSPIKAAVAWALGCSITVSWRCYVAPASVSEVGFGPAGPSLRLFNSTGHLE